MHAISHVTGGGLLENIPRVLPDHLAAELDPASCTQPEIFHWLQDQGNIATSEVYRVLDCVVGMVGDIAKEASSEASNHLK